MERETEQMTRSWDLAMSEKGGFLKEVLPLFVGDEMKISGLLKPQDDDGTDISLKDWHLGSRNSVEREVTAVYPIRPFKGSVRTRFSPIEPRLDEDMHSPWQSSPERFETAPTTPRTPRTTSSGTRSASTSPTRLDRTSYRQHGSSFAGDSSLQQLGMPNGDGHHLNIKMVSGVVSPHKSEIPFDESSLNDVNLDDSNYSVRSDRGLRVSFVEESDTLEESSPPTSCDRSPLTGRMTPVSKALIQQQFPKWESCTKILPQSAPMPKKIVTPNLHGVRPRKGITSAAKPRGSPLPLPEMETVYESHGVSASRDTRSQLRHSRLQVSRSLNSIGERSTYDSSSNYISRTPLPPSQSGREDTSLSNPTPPSFLLRSNGRRQHDDEEDDEEVGKVGMWCGGGLSDTNISGDLVRLLSKLCRVSVPLPKQSVSKPLQQRARKLARSTSIPTLLPWEMQNSTLPCKDYVIIGRYNSLKLLSERCSNGPTPAYNVRKPRKIRDHEPHQHYYKTISKTLDQKLRS